MSNNINKQLNYWSQNIKDGPKTSILGGLFIIAGIVSVFTAVASWFTAIAPIVFGTYLLCKEKKEKNK